MQPSRFDDMHRRIKALNPQRARPIPYNSRARINHIYTMHATNNKFFTHSRYVRVMCDALNGET